ncbi:DoxX family protein [Virgibacillus sp. C22-A2]|uniref:DoxX family protein n=1 Tax=Virgibacillus tibetensis TaxID=3042313 RepID=A0ABU6KFK5_9BACI|nr:DoxX family protein [Virgibacillus sp. C22-A2]
MFTTAAVSKTTNSQALVDQFDKLNLPQWFRIITGWVEVIGAVLFIIGL